MGRGSKDEDAEKEDRDGEMSLVKNKWKYCNKYILTVDNFCYIKCFHYICDSQQVHKKMIEMMKESWFGIKDDLDDLIYV